MLGPSADSTRRRAAPSTRHHRAHAARCLEPGRTLVVLKLFIWYVHKSLHAWTATHARLTRTHAKMGSTGTHARTHTMPWSMCSTRLTDGTLPHIQMAEQKRRKNQLAQPRVGRLCWVVGVGRAKDHRLKHLRRRSPPPRRVRPRGRPHNEAPVQQRAPSEWDGAKKAFFNDPRRQRLRKAAVPTRFGCCVRVRAV